MRGTRNVRYAARLIREDDSTLVARGVKGKAPQNWRKPIEVNDPTTVAKLTPLQCVTAQMGNMNARQYKPA